MLNKVSGRVIELDLECSRDVVSLDPFRCRMWAHHERLEESLTEEGCRAEIESYLKHGQLIPVLGRPLRQDTKYEVELVYGARRLFVAQHLRKPLLAHVRDMSDKEAVIAMEIENHHRQQTSPYERGLCFSRWLQSQLFLSQDEIAKALNISKSQVSRYVKMTKLPTVVLSAFSSPTHICESWGLDLLEAWEDPQRQRTIARRARALSSEAKQRSARQIYRLLMDHSVPRGRKPSALIRDEVVRSNDGAPLFRIRHQHHSVAVLLPQDRLSKGSLQQIRQFLSSLLQGAVSSAQDCDNLADLVPLSNSDDWRNTAEVGPDERRAIEADTHRTQGIAGLIVT